MHTWQIQIYDGRVWKAYGKVSTDFSTLYKMAQKINENGTKARVVKVL